jgi:hypothetical protein
MIAMAMHSEALTTMPATLAARWPGRWRTWARARAATVLRRGTMRPRIARHRGATDTTEAASHSAMAA